MSTNLRKWSTSASGNATVAGGATTVNFAEGQAPSTVNNSAREMMAQMRNWYTPSEAAWVEFSATVSVVSQTGFRIPGNQLADYLPTRRVRLRSGSTTRYGTIVSASYTTETQVTITVDSGSLSSSHSVVGISSIDIRQLPATTLASVAAIRALTAAYVAPTVDLLSYWDGLHIGGGRLYLDSASASDDNCTIFRDTVPRTWRRLHGGKLDLTQAGCKIDGTTDDLTYLNYAIAAVNGTASGIQTLTSPPGVMALSANPDPITRGLVSILGSGWSTSKWLMISAAGTNGQMISFGTDTEGASRVALKDIGFYFNNTATLDGTDPCIWFRQCSSADVSGLYINGCTGVFKFGGDTTDESAATILINNVRAQPEIQDGTIMLDYINATGVSILNSSFGEGAVGATSNTGRSIRMKSGLVGNDGHHFVNVTINTRASLQDYGYEFDCTNGGIANIRFSNCVLDGGDHYNSLFTLGVSASAADNRRMVGILYDNCRISCGLTAGGGIRVAQQWPNLIHAVSYVNCMITAIDAEIFRHTRSGGAGSNDSSFSFDSCSFIDDGGVVARSALFTESGNIHVRNCYFDSTRESITGAFTYGLEISSTSATGAIFTGNNCQQLTAAYPVNVDDLSTGDLTGITIANNSGKPQNPSRVVTTANATVTTLASQTLANSQTVRITGQVVAQQAAAANRATYSVLIIASASAGTATVHSSTVTTEYESNAAWNVTVDASGADVRIRVTGVAATTITWGFYDPIVRMML